MSKQTKQAPGSVKTPKPNPNRGKRDRTGIAPLRGPGRTSRSPKPSARKHNTKPSNGHVARALARARSKDQARTQPSQ